MSITVLLLFLFLPFVASRWGVDSRQTDDPRVTTEVAVMAARATLVSNAIGPTSSPEWTVLFTDRQAGSGALAQSRDAS